MKNLMILMLALFGSTQVFATTYVATCDGCNELTYRGKAMSTAMAIGSGGTFHILDYENEVIKAYDVELDVEYQQVIPVITGFPSVSQTLVSDFEKAVSVIESAELGVGNLELDPSHGTAYDALNDSNAYAAYATGVAANMGGVNFSTMWVGGYIVSITTKLANLDIVLTVDYSDGSSIRFSMINFRIQNGTLKFDLEFKAGNDAEGNVLHEDAEEYVNDTSYVPWDSGIYDFLGSQGAQISYFDLVGTGILGTEQGKCYTNIITLADGEVIVTATEVDCG